MSVCLCTLFQLCWFHLVQALKQFVFLSFFKLFQRTHFWTLQLGCQLIKKQIETWLTLTTKTTNTNHNLFSSNMATEYSRSHLVFSGALKNPELCKIPKQCAIPRGVHWASCTERRALDCARMKQASRALVCKRRDGRHSCCAAVLIKTCSPHNVSTPVPNTTRSLSHNVHACKEAAAAANKQKKTITYQLKIWHMYSKEYQQRGGDREDPVQWKEEDWRTGRLQRHRKGRNRGSARRNTWEYRVRHSLPIVPRNSKANITLDSSFLGHLSNGSVH